MSEAVATARLAMPQDIPVILSFLHALAAEEEAGSTVHTTEQGLHEVMFGDHPAASAHVVVGDGEVVGVALWYVMFSSWVGKAGIHIQDLYIHPEHRGRGYGRRLIGQVAAVCDQRNYGLIQWTVLKSNEPALRFYKSIGAQTIDKWLVQRLNDDALNAIKDPSAA